MVFGVGIAWNLVGNLVLPGVLYVPANLAVATGLLWFAVRSGLDRSALGLERAAVPWGIVWGLAAAGLIALVLVLAGSVSTFDDLLQSEDVAADSDFDRWFVPIVRIPLGTALFEEVLFRSVLFGVVLTLSGRWRALMVTSVVFGLWHITPAWEGASGDGFAVVGSIVGTVAFTTLAGVGFGLLRIWSRSLLAPTIAHAAANSFAYLTALAVLELI